MFWNDEHIDDNEVELPGDDPGNIVPPGIRGLVIARQLEELAKVVKDEDEKVDIGILLGLSMKSFRGALQLTGTILER